MRPVQIHPSILSADFSCLFDEIKKAENGGADGFHLDIMDGHFVPNISYGPPVIRSIRKATEREFWAHLMITNPGKYLKDYHEAGVQGITVHLEIMENVTALADEIHCMGIGAGISINPETDLCDLMKVVDCFDRVLVMSVHPGFGGQSFIGETMDKVKSLRTYADGRKRPLVIEVDGGINQETAPIAAAAGAHVLVAGSAVFRTNDPALAIQQLRMAAESDS